LETVNIEKLTKKAKIILKNFWGYKTHIYKTNTRLSIVDLIGTIIGFLALGDKEKHSYYVYIFS
jgi:hypothetical protein